ncbi:MAG: alpha/beta hydrolase [Gammaproteobacteria bacterium]|nr:alpha/beta hydrolase [Gammaproteobacteria bacterium]
MKTTITSNETRVSTPLGKIYVKRWQTGDSAGAPIVLFHDSLGCVSLWRDFPELLARATGREVIAYDRPGFGESDPHPSQLIPRTFVSDEAVTAFAALQKNLALQRFVVFGHSVGGAMAAICAATYVDNCEALITESAQVFAEEQTLQGIRDAKVSFTEAGQLDRLRRYHGDKAEWVLHAWIDSWLSDEFSDWTIEDILPTIVCPVLSIHGDKDEFGSLKHPELFTTLPAGKCEKQVLQGFGHVPHREDPQRVLDIVTAFLASV